ncbi:acyl-ACP desaturase [Streptomyces sp. NBC_00470]|uniref:acyl-ACP desaturase n=1 Tax=Streptomyces sp. NBC_00470 TaxID=2975753 RepID=UPI0030E1E6E3
MLLDVARELEPVVADALNDHYRFDVEWSPSRFIPWDEGRNVVEYPWEPSQSSFSPEIRAALEMALATEEDLPSYRSSIEQRFGRDGAWGEWIRRWTAEESRHGHALWAFMCATRAADPEVLDADMMATQQAGFQEDRKSVLEACVYVTIQERATRVSHAGTGRAAKGIDNLAKDLLQRIAQDENHHMIFYRRLVDAALEIDPSSAVMAISREIRGFQMPGEHTVPSFRRRAVLIAKAGIYNQSVHINQVIQPLLKRWKIFDIQGLDAAAEAELELLGAYLIQLRQKAAAEHERIERAKALREAVAR